MTLTPQAPAAALPTPPTNADPAEAKRQRFTLTRARDLDARLDAILMRANASLVELEAVGIVAVAEHEESSPVRQQLHQIATALANVVEQVTPAKGKSTQIVDLLEAL